MTERDSLDFTHHEDTRPIPERDLDPPEDDWQSQADWEADQADADNDEKWIEEHCK